MSITIFLISDNFYWQESISTVWSSATVFVLAKRALLSSEWVSTLGKLQNNPPQLLIVDLPNPATDKGSNADKRQSERIARYVDLMMEKRLPVSIVGRASSPAWNLSAIHRIILDPRMFRSMHSWCAWQLTHATSQVPLRNQQDVWSNYKMPDTPCKCPAGERHSPEEIGKERESKATWKENRIVMARELCRAMRAALQSKTDSKKVVSTSEVMISAASDAVQPATAYPTESRIRQKERKKEQQAKGVVVPPRKRKFACDEHYDDCGNDLDGLKLYEYYSEESDEDKDDGEMDFYLKQNTSTSHACFCRQ